MKKLYKLTMLLLTLTMSTSLIAQTPTPPANGDGSSGNPYQIATLNNLCWLSQTWTDWDKHYIQTSNIDASTTSGWYGGAGFPPIGDSFTGFFGSYDGQNYTIDGLYINRPSTNFIGLFGRPQSATIQNLGVTNVNISGNIYVGGLMGFCIESSSVSNCYSTGTVSGFNNVGGLVGLLNESDLSNSYSTVSVSGTDRYIGGLVGFCFEISSICNCYSTGSVSGDGDVGGLVGLLTLTSTVNNSYSTGIVSGNECVGGLVGRLLEGSTVNNSFWDTQTSGQSSSAGGTGKTTAEMKTQSTFTNAGWDFVGETTNGTNDYWDMYNTINSGYPFLSWQETSMTWNGSSSSDWNTADNWTGSLGVPTSSKNVTIPDVANDPVIDTYTNAVCNKLSMETGATLTVSGNLVVGN